VKFEPNVFKLIIRKKFMSSIPFALLIINVKTFKKFQNNGAHLVLKKKV